MSNAIKINKSRLSEMIRESIEKYLNNTKLIHVITGNALILLGSTIPSELVYKISLLGIL